MKKTSIAGVYRIKYRCFFILLTTALLCLSGPWAALAHPHVFVDCSLTFEFDENGLKGVRQKWWLDEMFAAMILGDYDKDQDRTISSDEAEAIKNGAFVNLKNFNYFTNIVVDGQVASSIEATEFKPYIEDSTLVYDFFVPLKVKAAPGGNVIMVAIYDESFYTSVQMDPRNKVKNLPSNMKSTLELEPVPEMAYFYDQIVPEAAVLTLSPK